MSGTASPVASRPSLAERYAAEFPLSRTLHDQAAISLRSGAPAVC